MISFFPFPYPVVTPLGEGYAVYVTANPMWENDTWCVQLDDGKIRHFSTNQLKGVPNGTYDIAPPKGSEPLITHLREPWDMPDRGPLAMPLCGAPGENHPPLLSSLLGAVNCPACIELDAKRHTNEPKPPVHYSPGPNYTTLCCADGPSTPVRHLATCKECERISAICRGEPKPTAPSSASAAAARRMAQKRK